jgi:hypothetical protein
MFIIIEIFYKARIFLHTIYVLSMIVTQFDKHCSRHTFLTFYRIYLLNNQLINYALKLNTNNTIRGTC